MLIRAVVVACALLAAVPVLAQTGAKPAVIVVEPWARATPAGAKVGAAYFELKSTAGAADRLVSAASPAAGVTEIHTHIMDGGIARMRRVDGIDVPAGGSVQLKPGGYHIMLMNLKSQLRSGDTIKLNLVFEKAGAMEVDVKVQPVGASGAGPMHKH